MNLKINHCIIAERLYKGAIYLLFIIAYLAEEEQHPEPDFQVGFINIVPLPSHGGDHAALV